MKTFPGNLSQANPMRMQQVNPQQLAQGMANHVLINDKEYEDVVCQCGSRHFDHSVRKKRVSGMDPANPFKEERFVDLIVNVCKSCKKELRIAGPQQNCTFEKPVEVIH